MTAHRTKTQLIETWRDAFDESYTVPLEDEDDGRGVDVIYGFAAVMERASQGIETTTQAMYINPHSEQTAPPAAGAAKATGTLFLTRTVPAHGTVELKEGDLLEVTQLGTKGETLVVAEIELSADVTLVASAVDVPAAVVAVRAGYQSNSGVRQSVRFKSRTIFTIDGVTTAGATNTLTDTGGDDRFAEGMDEGVFVQFVTGANAGTTPRRIETASLGTVTVDGAALSNGTDNIQIVGLDALGIEIEISVDLSGGLHAWLDQIGGERLIARNPSEADADYFERVRALPDTISPNAVLRAVGRILRPKSIPFEVIETRIQDEFAGFFYDLDPYDDPAATIDGNRRLLLGAGFHKYGFIVLVERQNTGEFGFPYDDNPSVTLHPSNAYDVGVYDGYPAQFVADLLELVAEVDKTRASGVPWAIAIVESL